MAVRTIQQLRSDDRATADRVAQAAPAPVSPVRQGREQAVLALQQTHGNRFVQRLLGRAAAAGANPEVSAAVEAGIDGARGSGQPLADGVRDRFEPLFGASFAGVRVHDNGLADSLSRSLEARAFTVGSDIFFRQGEYDPASADGQELLAHELTHVVQQSATPQAKLMVSQPGDRSEEEAEATAREVVGILQGHSTSSLAPARAATADAVARQEEEEQHEPPRIVVKSVTWEQGAGAGGAEHSAKAPDKSFSEESQMQDQNASVTTLVATANGVRIVVEAVGVYTSATYPDGFKWTQTIDTNVPLGGTTSPYVDPRPNDDTKPFYYTDAEHAASPTTFRDRPSRPAPATGTTTWDAILGLNGVDESAKTVTGFDYLTYGFSIDSSGTVTMRNATAGSGANHRSTLSSEFPQWTFS